MGDPGLKSKFVAMQQEEPPRKQPRPPSRNLDLCRIEQQLRTTSNERYRIYLLNCLRGLKAR